MKEIPELTRNIWIGDDLVFDPGWTSTRHVFLTNGKRLPSIEWLCFYESRFDAMEEGMHLFSRPSFFLVVHS